ncbi:MAG: NAD(P)/FAD-dependent oxidoreductase [Candidatus Paceibacterota bacterium]
MSYDLIIIGGGPAGTAAAVYAARKKLKTLLIIAEWGGQSIVSEKIYNWIGTPEIAGNDLAKSLKDHVMANVGEDLSVAEGEKVTSVTEAGKEFTVITENGKTYNTKTILVASGSGRRKLEALGADRLEHKGLTYCASCDGPLFSGQDVVVVGGGNAAFESAAQLLAYCNSVTLLHRSDRFRADPITVEKLSQNPKLKIMKNIDVLEVMGEKFVAGVKIKDKTNNQESELKVSGIFVEIGQIPNTSYIKDLVQLDEMGRIKIDPWTGRTDIEGVWAAGDCTNVLYHQNNIAAGDAVRALENIYASLHTR